MANFPTALAANTYSGYLRLSIRFEEWATRTRIDQSQWWEQAAWTTFIKSLNVTPQGTHAYLKTASAIIASRSKSAIQMASNEAKAAGALKSIRQAPPLRKDEVDHPSLQTADLRLALLVAWKTSSRWDEVQRLSAEAVDVYEDPEPTAIIDWDQGTKASRLDPHRASRYAVIVGEHTAEIINLLRSWPPGAPLTTLTTSGITARLKSVRAELSAHSIKAGALDVLAKAVVAGTLTEQSMCRLAKHKRLDDMPSTTLRYIRDKRTLALMLNTQQASRHL